MANQVQKTKQNNLWCDQRLVIKLLIPCFSPWVCILEELIHGRNFASSRRLYFERGFISALYGISLASWSRFYQLKEDYGGGSTCSAQVNI